MHTSEDVPRRCATSHATRSILLASTLVLASCTARLVRQAEADYPRLGEIVHAEGLALHYVERGSGPPVLLLHGAFGGVQDFTSTIVPELATRARAIAFDRPGHGYSERPKHVVATPDVQARIVHEAVRTLGIDRPVVVGFSWGGAVALAYALAYPDDVAAVVTINAPVREWSGAIDPLYYVPEIVFLGDLFVSQLVMPLGLWRRESAVERAFAPRTVPETFALSPIALALRPHSFRANAEDVRTLKGFLARQSSQYEQLALPLVIVVSQSDQIVDPRHHAEFLHAHVTGSEIVRVPDAGHPLLYTHPEVVLRAIDRALELAAERTRP